MILFILSILFIVGGITAYLLRRSFKSSTSPTDNATSLLVGSIAALVIGILLFFGSCTKIVPANSVGIPVSFGSIGSPVDSGFHLMAPWTNIHTFSTRLQESSMLGDPSEGDRATDDAVDVRGSDEGVVFMDVTVRYTVTKETASELFKRTGSMDGIRNKIIRPDTRSLMRDVAKDYIASDLVAAKRSDVEAKTTELLKARMAKNYGITVDSVLLRGVRPSLEVEKAIQAKLTKAQEVQQALLQQQKETTEALTRQKVADADAVSTKTKAQAAADAVRITAQGEADANAKKSASLTPEILRQLQIEALKAGTVYVVPDGGNFILGDLTKATK